MGRRESSELGNHCFWMFFFLKLEARLRYFNKKRPCWRCRKYTILWWSGWMSTCNSHPRTAPFSVQVCVYYDCKFVPEPQIFSIFLKTNAAFPIFCLLKQLSLDSCSSEFHLVTFHLEDIIQMYLAWMRENPFNSTRNHTTCSHDPPRVRITWFD